MLIVRLRVLLSVSVCVWLGVALGVDEVLADCVCVIDGVIVSDRLALIVWLRVQLSDCVPD